MHPPAKKKKNPTILLREHDLFSLSSISPFYTKSGFDPYWSNHAKKARGRADENDSVS
jgi:hypothetical protein